MLLFDLYRILFVQFLEFEIIVPSSAQFSAKKLFSSVHLQVIFDCKVLGSVCSFSLYIQLMPKASCISGCLGPELWRSAPRVVFFFMGSVQHILSLPMLFCSLLVVPWMQKCSNMLLKLIQKVSVLSIVLMGRMWRDQDLILNLQWSFLLLKIARRISGERNSSKFVLFIR